MGVDAVTQIGGQDASDSRDDGMLRGDDRIRELRERTVGEGLQEARHQPESLSPLDAEIAAALDVVARARLFQEWVDAQ